MEFLTKGVREKRACSPELEPAELELELAEELERAKWDIRKSTLR